MNNLIVKDETAAGQILHELALQFDNEYISVKDLIEARIKEEVKKYEQNKESYTKGLVLPTNLEKRLNNKKERKIDIEKQMYLAFDAFNKNGYFIFVDDDQVEDLDQKFLIEENTKVSFLKLTPLVGG
ncbi:MAG: hypothetical protein JXQ87_08005 [Bacteroidia bacterium]